MLTYSKKKWYKPETLSGKLIIIAALILFIRLLSNVPVPFINRDYLSVLFEDSSAYSLLNTFSGGSFTRMTVMALGVTPYITASIILQLLTVTFPRLKAYQQENEYSNKWKILTVLTSLILGVIQSIGIAVTLGRRGLFTSYTFGIIVAVTTIWLIGALIVTLIGEYISKYCIGNGVSIILAANIIAELPSDILHFYQMYISDTSIIKMIIAIISFIVIVSALIILTVIFTNAKKEIPVQYPSNANSRHKNTASIPIMLNAAGVMPIIFASTIFSVPLMFIAGSNNSIANAFKHAFSSSYWYSLDVYGIIGLITYFFMVIGFAYFYTAMIFNPTEIANRLRRKGACIPGIRPGQPTEEYLYRKSKRMTFIGAILIFILSQIPTMIMSFTSMKTLSFGDTSIIIIVGVVAETAITIKAEMLTKKYVAKTNKTFFGIETTRAIK